MQRIEFTTKPNGSRNYWPEVGVFTGQDNFGDIVWQPTEDRYPQKDSRLKVQRKFDGRGASQRISWIIDIPEEYPHTIILRDSGRERSQDEIEWEPSQETGDEAAKQEAIRILQAAIAHLQGGEKPFSQHSQAIQLIHESLGGLNPEQ